MNFNWLIPSLLISYLGNDRVPKSLSTTLERRSSDNSSPSPSNTTTTTTTTHFTFSPPISHPHDLDYLSPLFTTFFLLPPLLNTSSSLIISPLATKLSLLTLITLGDDGQQAELLRQLEVPPLPPLANSSTELLHQGANLRHYLTTTTTRTNLGKLHNYFFAIDSLLFVDRQLFYYDYDHQLADRLESSGLLSLGFYPLKVAASSSSSAAEEVGSSTAFESWRQFEAFKRTHLPRHFHPFSKQLKLPEENTLTTLTSFSQQWPLPFNRLAASKYSIPFYPQFPSGQQFSRPPFLTRVLHNSRYLHQHRFGTHFVEVPFEEDSLSANSPKTVSLIIALPDQNSSLTTLIQGLSQYRALPREVLPYLQPTPVNLTLPAFQLTSSNLDLMDSLLSTSLSLSSSSQSKENRLNLNRLFPSISTRLSSVQQLCSLSLTSTGVYSSFSEDDPLHLPPDFQHDVQPVYVRAEISVLVNRPFLFLITESITSTGNGRNMFEVLYAGAVINP